MDVLNKVSRKDWFNVLFENKMTGIIIVSLDGKFLRVNQTYCKITGYSEAELLGMTQYDFTPEIGLEALYQIMNRISSQEIDSFETEKQIITKSGKLKWVEIKSSIIEPGSDLLLSFIADIDEKKRTEEALKKSESELRLAQKVANIGSWYIDLQTRETKWSEEMYTILDLDKNEKPLGWGVAELVHPDDRELFKQKMGAFEDFDNLEIRHVAKKGFNILRISARILYEDNVPVKFYGTVQDVSEHRKLEQRIHEAQELARLGWWEVNLLTQQTVWSDSIYSLLEADPNHGPLTHDEFIEKIHPEDVKYISMDPALLKNGWKNAILRYKRKGGGYKHVLSNGKVLFDGDKPVRLVGTHMDITEAIELQDKLQEVQRIAKVGWYEYDLMNSNNHRVSKELSELLEIPQSDGPVDAHEYIAAMPPEDQKNFLCRIQNIHEYPDGWDNHIFRINTKSGRYLYIAGSARVAYEDNRPVRIFGTVYDITKIKQYEQELAENHINLKALITSMENIVFIVNDDRKFEKVFCNDPELLLFSKEEYLGKSLHDIWHDSPQQLLADLAEKVLKTEKEESYVFKEKQRDKEIWWHANVKIFRSVDDTNRIAIIVNDITTKKAAEEELIKSVHKEKELSEMRAQFVSMASHQFRTPLTVIKSNMELLELAGVTHPVVTKVKQRLQVETDRLIELMEDVMAMGKVQSGNVQINLQPVCIPDLIYKTKMNVERHLRDNRSAEVITFGEERAISIDVKFMEHALNNLIENAFKYSPGCANPEIRLHYSADKLRIGIRDFGIGIAEADRRKLFNAFQRGSNTNHIPGTGLGLATAKEFVELNHGSLFLNEMEEEGTEFCIDLPLDK